MTPTARAGPVTVRGVGLGALFFRGCGAQGPDDEPDAEGQHQRGDQEAEDAGAGQDEHADDRSEDYARQSVQHEAAYERSGQGADALVAQQGAGPATTL